MARPKFSPLALSRGKIGLRISYNIIALDFMEPPEGSDNDVHQCQRGR